MKIFADQHHDALYFSLQLLFEKRFGFELYRPIGLEWYENGFWHVFPHVDTAKQYLSLNQKIDWPKDVHGKPLHPQQCLNLNYRHEDGIYYVEDIPRGVYQRAITLEKFKETKFDVVISSMPGHVAPFNRLIKEFQPQAKHIMQLGNNWNAASFDVKNILSSARRTTVRPDQSVVYYHQEFDLSKFHPGECQNPKSVINMMHHIPENAKKPFLYLEGKMPHWKWSLRGACNRDDAVLTEKIPETIREHGFLWHVKREGDGFGYNLHHAAACGRPIITHKNHFSGMTAEPLLIDGKTCIDLDKHPIDQVPSLLERASDNFEEWRTAVRNRFDEIVNYEKEAEDIRVFLANLR